MEVNCSSKSQSFQTLDSLTEIPTHIRGSVVAIGNFDGVHRGHRAVIDTALGEAKERNVSALAVTFEPHPRTVFRPEHPVFRLTQRSAKAEIFNALGFDGVLEIPFDRNFAEKSADSFVNDILLDKLQISHIVVGYDFHFGQHRKGTPDFLEERGKLHGFGVTIVEQYEDENSELVSSSRIREALSAGDIVYANSQLGYRWFLDAVVQHGEKRGRTLGFPTANLHIPEEYRLQLGIYAVRVHYRGKRYDGVASYGRRPTFDNGAPILEVFIFNFAEEIYGETLKVTFCSYLRTEQKFSDVESLIVQMNKDVEDSRAVLTGLKPLSDLDQTLDQGSLQNDRR